jgi:hypothetical protein
MSRSLLNAARKRASRPRWRGPTPRFGLVNGNPLENMSVMTDPEVNFDLIMKDSVIYMNTIK